MSSTYAKSLVYAVVLLSPLATQASNSDHQRKQDHPERNYHSQERYNGHSQDRHHGANATLPVASVPEPGSLALLGAGIAGLAFFRRKKVS